MQANRLVQQPTKREAPSAAHPALRAQFPLDLQTAIADPRAATPEALQSMQQQAGNQAVLDWLKRPAAGGGLDTGFSGAVQAAHGTGQALPGRLREELEHDLGADFGGVRLHVDEQADALNQQIEARAFTVGADIFFQHGAYSPHSAEGQRTLRHELTHVVQQRGRFTPHLRLGPENDAHEQEAERFAARGEALPARAPAATGAAPIGSVQRTGKWGLHLPSRMKKTKDKDVLGKVLGDSANSVYPVRSARGPQDTKAYFKPANTRKMAQNFASTRMDQWLGLNSLSKDRIAERNPGDGKTLGIESPKVAGQQVKQLKDFDYSNANTQRGMANIQLQAAITGQSDYHGGNVFVDPTTGETTAIDHEQAFGDSQMTSKISALPGTKQYRSPEALKMVAERGNSWSQNHYLGLPSHIDAGAAQKVLMHKAEDLPKVLDTGYGKGKGKISLSPGEVAEAQQRYKVTKNYVKAGIAHSPDAAGQLTRMGIDPSKAAKWKSKWQERYSTAGVAAPKIVDQWNQQTYAEQLSTPTEAKPMSNMGKTSFGYRTMDGPMSDNVKVQVHGNLLQRTVEGHQARAMYKYKFPALVRGKTNFLGGDVRSHVGTEPAPLAISQQRQLQFEAKQKAQAAAQQEAQAKAGTQPSGKSDQINQLKARQATLEKMIARGSTELQPKLDGIIKQLAELESNA